METDGFGLIVIIDVHVMNGVLVDQMKERSVRVIVIHGTTAATGIGIDLRE